MGSPSELTPWSHVHEQVIRNVQGRNRKRRSSKGKPEHTEKVKAIHPDYRLWITTESRLNFPVSLLQLSLKLTNEPLAGVRASLTRTFQGRSQPE